MVLIVRPAEPGDLSLLADIEREADSLFADYGLVLPPGDPVVEWPEHADSILVVGRPPVGFALIGTVDGLVHLKQLAVHPAYHRRGLGGFLVEAVCDHARKAGRPAVTLTTFRDVPWNARWYAKHGFRELPSAAWGSQLRAIWQAEGEAGLGIAARVVMRRLLS